MNTKRHKHADLIIAWAEGAKIQVSYLGYGKKLHDKFWLYDPHPIWCPTLAYRIYEQEIETQPQLELEIKND